MDLPLALLSAEAVATYLAARFSQQQFPAALVPWLHQRTDGHPLFLVTLVQALVERGVLHEHDGRWTVHGDIEALVLDVPESLRQLLEQQITRLPLEAQRVLEVASVAGVEFVAAAVAAGLDTDVVAVEEHCEALVRQQVLRPLGVTTWPNGTVATRYAFRHALYQQVVYERLGAGRRVRLHQRLGGLSGGRRMACRLVRSLPNWRSTLCAARIPGAPCTICIRRQRMRPGAMRIVRWSSS